VDPGTLFSRRIEAILKKDISNQQEFLRVIGTILREINRQIYTYQFSSISATRNYCEKEKEKKGKEER